MSSQPGRRSSPLHADPARTAGRPQKSGIRIVLRDALATAAVAALAMACIPAGPARAQYAMQRFTVDGGGGTSTGGTYALSGTVGQPDAGTLTGGSYVLAGGFWFGGTAISSVQPPAAPAILQTRLDPVSPNPCRGSTTVSFSLATPQVVRAEIFDVRGTRVRTILSGPRPAGVYRAVWNGADDSGKQLASGIYLLRFGIGNEEKLQKIALLR